VGGLLVVVDGVDSGFNYPGVDYNGTAPGPGTAPADPVDDDYVPLMDHLGNVTGLHQLSYANLTLQGTLDYDAFGREIRSTGPACDKVPFHFSTKFTDPETGLNYYCYRFYDPNNGRWPSRDPIEERGGLNLYGMVGNNGVNTLDGLGLIGIFFDGAGQNKGSGTFIDKFFNEYAGVAVRANTMVYPNNIRANINAAHEKVCEEVCKDTANDKIDIFGWSRGAVAALELAKRLNDDGCDCECSRVYPPIRFLGIVDTVSTGGIQMIGLEDDHVPDNVRNAHHALRDKDYNTADKTVFAHQHISAENPTSTKFTTSTHSVSHQQTGWERGVESSLRNAAIAAGVPIKP
jgi:RHS repeat-associated protein